MRTTCFLCVSFLLAACSGTLGSSTAPDGSGERISAPSDGSTRSEAGDDAKLGNRLDSASLGDGSIVADRSTASDGVSATPDTNVHRDAKRPRDAVQPADTTLAVLDSTPSADFASSGGCGAAATPGFTCFDVQFKGSTRKWCMNVPKSYEPKRPYSLMIGLHGCGGNASNVHRHRANMEAYGDRDFLFAYPQAKASCWSFRDIDFVKEMVSTITAEYCLKQGRVFVHGMSSGGSMASMVASSGMVKAFASVSAGGTAGAMPAWYYAGTSDSYYSQIVQSKNTQVARNGCGRETTAIPDSPCVSYNGCKHAVVYCEDTRGHVWPAEVWAQERMIDFFRAVP